MTEPCQTVIKNGITIKGTMDTTAKFNLMTEGVDLKGKRVLDVGCNEGMMCQLAAEQGANVLGIDINRDVIKQAKENFPHLNFECLSAEKMYGNYDIIIASAVLHYLDLDKTFAIFSRCVKQVICDIWLHPSEVPIFALTTRGIYIPSMSAFMHIASKYFSTIDLIGPSHSPDDSERFIFHLSNPLPNPPSAVIIYGIGDSGKSTLSRTYFNHSILRTDDIFFAWKEAHIHLMLSISFFSDMLRAKYLSNYLEFCTKEITNWLMPRLNHDIVIEGYDLCYEDYRTNVIDLLKSHNYKITEISL